MKIVILGGGISGLSAAWYLRKAYPEAKVTLLEKEGRLGGFIETMKVGGVFVEKGPRTFVVSRSKALLQFIQDVGLQEEILFSNQQSSRRYLLHKGKLSSLSTFLPMLLPALLREVFISKGRCEDESIYDFAIRRFNKKIAETLFDPMALGIFAGDIRTLSLRTCFPFLHQWEAEGSSVLRKMFSKKKDGRLFTLREGMGSLIEAAKKIDVDFVLNCRVQKIESEGVYAGDRFWAADRIFSALPGKVLGSVTGLWNDFPTTSLWVVMMGFAGDVLLKKGFGYLVPSKEGEALLGCVWDSSIFPRNKTVLTAMIRNQGDRTWAILQALSALRRHLGITEPPDFIESYLAEEAIPQFQVGYAKRLSVFQTSLQERFPSLVLLGNYLDGVSVDACIALSRESCESSKIP